MAAIGVIDVIGGYIFCHFTLVLFSSNPMIIHMIHVRVFRLHFQSMHRNALTPDT